MHRITTIVLALIAALGLSLPVYAAKSLPHNSVPLTAHLISAENGVSPDASSLSAGLLIDLNEGWKTYWRTPGEAGLPPEVIWEGSKNIKSVDFQYPVPKRFETFGIENLGYEDQVLFPLRIELENTGAPAFLIGSVSLLVCSNVCIPADFNLSLRLGAKTGVDIDTANLIAEYAAKVPLLAETPVAAYINPDQTMLSTVLRGTTALNAPDILPELGSSSFGHPIVQMASNGTDMNVQFPITVLDGSAQDLRFTVTDGDHSITHAGNLQSLPLFDTTPRAGLLWILGLALLGGLILNIMPCVLPVLTIKLASALKYQDAPASQIRGGFLMSAFGVLSFMWLLAVGLIIAKSMGQAVGWGLHFQDPYFLVIMIALILAFAANMLGLFEISLPQSWNSTMSDAESCGGYRGAYLTGAFAAVLSTPCSAPFLGTAVAFALSGTNMEILIVFTALGIGLAAPYLLFAAVPKLISALPKPGAWMGGLKTILALLLLATAVWLLWVLVALVGLPAATIALVAIATAIAALCFAQKSGFGLAIVGLVLALLTPIVFDKAPTQTQLDSNWQTFDQAAIADHVANGKTVFVDVTADWCLTCKANKRLVLNSSQIETVLSAENIVKMQADWTRPSDIISTYLNENGRYGIPFNIAYGPGAPNGIPLPEVLTKSSVLTAIETAR